MICLVITVKPISLDEHVYFRIKVPSEDQRVVSLAGVQIVLNSFLVVTAPGMNESHHIIGLR